MKRVLPEWGEEDRSSREWPDYDKRYMGMDR